MDYCSTEMSLSESHERTIGSGTHFPEDPWQAVAFRIGGVPLDGQWERGTLRRPVCHGS